MDTAQVEHNCDVKRYPKNGFNEGRNAVGDYIIRNENYV